MTLPSPPKAPQIRTLPQEVRGHAASTGFGILPVGNLGSRWSPCPLCRVGKDCEHIHLGINTTEMVCFVCNHTYAYMYLYPCRHMCTHMNVFFITVHIRVHTHVPYPPALLVGGLNPGTPVWLVGTTSLGSVPSPHFFLVAHRKA